MTEPFPWSATRARTFQECRRKFYYRYQVAPGGRRPDAGPEAREAHRVKDLVGVEAWAGELVHTGIQQVLQRWRAGRVCSEAEVVALAQRLLHRRFFDSQRYWDAHPDEYPSRPPLLDVHYFRDGAVSRDRAKAVKELVIASLVAFVRSELADRIRVCGPGSWLPIDRNAAARLPGELLILVKPDFAFRDGETLRILDWKTGKPDPFWESVQVICYALYAQEKWRHPLPQIDPRIVHLYPELRISETEFTPERVRDIQLFVRETQEDIAATLQSRAPVEERFPFCEDGRRCRWCQFRGMCEGAARFREAAAAEQRTVPSEDGRVQAGR